MLRFLTFPALFLTACAFGQVVPSSSDSTSSPDNGNIHFLRSTGYQGSATAFTVFIDDVIVCRLNNKRYSIHSVPPGKHSISVQFAGKKSKELAERIEVEVEPGKNYFIQLIFQPGFFINNLYCQEVTENSAKKVIPQLKIDKNCE